MTEGFRDTILFQHSHTLPFYSQVLCSIHRNDKNITTSKELPKGRTLFLRALDPTLSQESIARGLSNLGKVDVTPVTKHAPSGDGRVTNRGLYHAIFEEAKTVKKLIGNKGKRLCTVIPAKVHVPKQDGTFLMSALEKRRAMYRGMDILQKNADECLMEYDISADIQRRLDQEVTVDEEGFTLVTTGPDAVKSTKHRTVKRQREGQTTTINFYRFPNKEAVMSTMEKEAQT